MFEGTRSDYTDKSRSLTSQTPIHICDDILQYPISKKIRRGNTDSRELQRGENQKVGIFQL